MRLRDEEKLSFLKIGPPLGIGNTTASRHYDRGKAADDPLPHKRGRYSNLPKEAFDTIESMLGGEHTVAEIAEAAGCSENTVRRRRKSRPK